MCDQANPGTDPSSDRNCAALRLIPRRRTVLLIFLPSPTVTPKRWHPDQPGYDYRGRAETVTLMAKLGYTKRQLAEAFGVSTKTIQRDLAKARKSR